MDRLFAALMSQVFARQGREAAQAARAPVSEQAIDSMRDSLRPENATSEANVAQWARAVQQLVGQAIAPDLAAEIAHWPQQDPVRRQLAALLAMTDKPDAAAKQLEFLTSMPQGERQRLAVAIYDAFSKVHPG